MSICTMSGIKKEKSHINWDLGLVIFHVGSSQAEEDSHIT